ncbi:unnamed protein product [Closterium sp. Naga37s-1]|nr:unnamed protein product [Closterium sp. Naga37s-1]
MRRRRRRSTGSWAVLWEMAIRVAINGTVIFVYFNAGYNDMLENWAWHVQAVGLGGHFIIFAADQTALAFATSTWPGQAILLPFSGQFGQEEKISNESAHVYGDAGFHKVASHHAGGEGDMGEVGATAEGGGEGAGKSGGRGEEVSDDAGTEREEEGWQKRQLQEEQESKVAQGESQGKEEEGVQQQQLGQQQEEQKEQEEQAEGGEEEDFGGDGWVIVVVVCEGEGGLLLNWLKGISLLGFGRRFVAAVVEEVSWPWHRLSLGSAATSPQVPSANASWVCSALPALLAAQLMQAEQSTIVSSSPTAPCPSLSCSDVSTVWLKDRIPFVSPDYYLILPSFQDHFLYRAFAITLSSDVRHPRSPLPSCRQVFSLSPFPSSSLTVALSLKCPPPNAFLLSPPIACSLSLPSLSSLPSRRLLALPPVTFSPLPSPSRSLPRCLRDLPPVDCALSLPSPSRSLPRGLPALRPIAWALSPPLVAFLLSPPIACSLSLPSLSSLPSRRLLALPPVTFSPLPSPSRSLPRCLRDLPPVDCALSLPSPSRSLPRGLLALRPIAWALSPPLVAFLLSPPIACSLSLSSPSSLPSRRLLALPPVTFFSPLPSPSRSLPRCLRDLPPVDCALSLPSPSRSLPRGLLALCPIAWALSLPSPLQFPLSSRRPLHLLSLTSSLPVGIALTFLPPIDIALTSSRPVVRLLSPIPSFTSSPLPPHRSLPLPSHPVVRLLSPPIPSPKSKDTYFIAALLSSLAYGCVLDFPCVVD